MAGDLDTLLDAESQQLEREAVEIQARINQDSDRLAIVQRRLAHVRALLHHGGTPEVQDARAVPQGDYGNGAGDGTSNVCDIAVEILGERNGESMYYKELAEEVIRRGGSLTGPTPWASLTARMVQDPRFVRPVAKGFYALRKDYPNARNVGARVHARRTQRRARSYPAG